MARWLRLFAFTRANINVMLWYLVLLPFAMSNAVDPRPALGFDLGLSYGTAVAHLANGTIIEIAKVGGSRRYQTFLQRQLRKRRDYWWHPSWREMQREDLFRRVQEYTGIGGPDGATILAEMLIELRHASEHVLGAPLPATLMVTVPHIHAWKHQECLLRSYVETARERAGLRPTPIESIAPRYLCEANTVVAAHGYALCPDRWCNGAEWTEERPYMNQWIYFISFTNDSLYTSFQEMTCFFLLPPGSFLADSRPELGLDQLDLQRGGGKEVFWRKQQEHLVSQHRVFAGEPELPRGWPLLVVVAGEAANNPDFLDVIEGAITDMQNDPAHWFKENDTKQPPEIELLVSNDPVYAAAKGAALLQRTSMDSSYCHDFFDKEEEYRAQKIATGEYERDEL